MRKQLLTLAIGAALLASCQSKQSGSAVEADSTALKAINDSAFTKHIAILASDDFEG